MRIYWAFIPFALLNIGCYGIHIHWEDVGLEDAETRKVSGFVLDPTKASAMFDGSTQFMSPMLGAVGGVAGVRVCVTGAMPEKCSDPSGADGSYLLELDLDGMDVSLSADVAGAADFVAINETRYIKAKQGEVIDKAPVENLNVYLMPKSLLSAAATAAGLASAEDALAKGAGMILSEELLRVGGNYVMPTMIDVDAIGPVEKLFAVKSDGSLEELEASNPNQPYPIAMAIYIGNGSTEEIIVTLCDPALVGLPQDSKMYPLIFEEEMFPNEPNMFLSVRVKIHNALARYHGDETPPPAHCMQ